MQPDDELHARASKREASRSVPPAQYSTSLENAKQAPFIDGKEKEETSSEGEADPGIQGASPSAARVHTADPAPKKPSPKIVKAPQAPKRFKPAFIFFSAEKHKEIRAQLGVKAQSEKTSNISKLVSEAWKSLNAEEKKKWETMARNDKIRYEVEKSMYEGPWHVQKTRKQKDVNAPKRPMSAFLAFANQRRGTVKRQMPNATNGEVSRALATMWRSAPDDVRQQYINDEYEQRQEYKAVTSVWKKKVDDDKREERQQREAMALRFAEVQGAPYNMDSIFQVDGLVDQSYRGRTDNNYTGYAMASPHVNSNMPSGLGAPYNMDSLRHIERAADELYYGRTGDDGVAGYDLASPRFNNNMPSNVFPNYASYQAHPCEFRNATGPRQEGLPASTDFRDLGYPYTLGMAQQHHQPLSLFENHHHLQHRPTVNEMDAMCSTNTASNCIDNANTAENGEAVMARLQKQRDILTLRMAGLLPWTD